MTAVSPATTAAATTSQPAAPKHTFVVPAAINAAADAGRLVTQLNTQKGEFTKHVKSVETLSVKSNDGWEAVLRFYKTVRTTIDRATALLDGVGTIIAGTKLIPNTDRRKPQYDLLGKSEAVEAQKKKAEKDADALPGTIASTDISQTKKATEDQLDSLAPQLRSKVLAYIQSKNHSGGILLYSYTIETLIDSCLDMLTPTRNTPPPALPLANAIPTKPLESNLGHSFFVKGVQKLNEGITGFITALEKMTSSLPQASSNSVDDIKAAITAWDAWKTANEQKTSKWMTALQEALRLCTIASEDSSVRHTLALQGIGFETEFNAALDKAKADKREVEARIAKLSKLEKALSSFETDLENKCYAALGLGTISYWSSTESAVARFRREFMTNSASSPVTAGTASASTTAPTAATSAAAASAGTASAAGSATTTAAAPPAATTAAAAAATAAPTTKATVTEDSRLTTAEKFLNEASSAITNAVTNGRPAPQIAYDQTTLQGIVDLVANFDRMRISPNVAAQLDRVQALLNNVRASILEYGNIPVTFMVARASGAPTAVAAASAAVPISPVPPKTLGPVTAAAATTAPVATTAALPKAAATTTLDLFPEMKEVKELNSLVAALTALLETKKKSLSEEPDFKNAKEYLTRVAPLATKERGASSSFRAQLNELSELVTTCTQRITKPAKKKHS